MPLENDLFSSSKNDKLEPMNSICGMHKSNELERVLLKLYASQRELTQRDWTLVNYQMRKGEGGGGYVWRPPANFFLL